MTFRARELQISLSLAMVGTRNQNLRTLLILLNEVWKWVWEGGVSNAPT